MCGMFSAVAFATFDDTKMGTGKGVNVGDVSLRLTNFSFCGTEESEEVVGIQKNRIVSMLFFSFFL